MLKIGKVLARVFGNGLLWILEGVTVPLIRLMLWAFLITRRR